jgi:hypothetical protein
MEMEQMKRRLMLMLILGMVTSIVLAFSRCYEDGKFKVEDPTVIKLK